MESRERVNPMQAVEFLKSSESQEIGPAVAVFGADRYLRTESIRAVCHRVFPEEEAEAGPIRLAGSNADLRTVFDTLRTISMWAERQLVVIEDADDFVSDHRAELEKYVDKPSRRGVLLLDLKSFPSNTRLYKKVAAAGLLIDCAPLKDQAVPAWIAEYAKRHIDKKLDRPAIQLLIELVGNDLGLLAQELGKLAAFVGPDPTITAEAVQAVVGGWRLRTTWEMLDAVLEGRTGPALQMLNKLLEAGDAPQQIMGGVNWMFRPLAQALSLSRQKMPLSAALSEAGVKFNNLKKAEPYLKKLNADRARQIGRWLLQADLDMKGGSGLPERNVLERLLIQLSGQ